MTRLSPLKAALLELEKARLHIRKLEGRAAEPVAVIGIGCRFPGGERGVEGFWRFLSDGGDAVGPPPENRFTGSVVPPEPAHSAAYLTGVDGFDREFFGMSRPEAAGLDPQVRILLEVAWEALEDGGQDVHRLAGSRTGVFIGCSSSDYLWLGFEGGEPLDPHTSAGTARCMAANRISYQYDLRGPSMVFDASCASSLVAVHVACQSLRAGECDLALAGGVNLLLSPWADRLTEALVPRARAERCRSFDAGADGIVRGEGCGLVALRLLSETRARQEPVRVVLCGSAVNQDGRSNGITAPNGRAQREVLQRALEVAGVSPGDVGYIEAHGTGTALGDPIELASLAEVFGEGANRPAVASVKSNLGHLEAAAGIAGLIKTALVVERGVIPPHLHYEQPNPEAGRATELFEIPSRLRSWKGLETPRRAGVSAFSIGGTNAHVVVEQAPGEAPDPRAQPSRSSVHLLPVSAHSAEALRVRVADFRALLDGTEAPSAEDLCFTAGARRAHLPHRVAVVGRSVDELRTELGRFLDGEGPLLGEAGRASERPGGLVFVFAGQGAQHPEMGRGLMAERIVRETVELCDRHGGVTGGAPILDVLAAGSVSLADPESAQLALFAVQIALVRLLDSWGVSPDAVVGHSVGEVAAAHSAGALTLEQALGVVGARSRLSSRLVGSGGMVWANMWAAEAEEMVASCQGASVAAVNGPRSVVLTGDTGAIERVGDLLDRAGVRHRRLPLDIPFHSVACDPLGSELADCLRTLEPTDESRPFWSTVAAAPVRGAALDGEYWGENLKRPVRFEETVGGLVEQGYRTFVEIGPKPVLLRELEDLTEEVGGHVFPTLRRGGEDRVAVRRCAAGLYVAGRPIRWETLAPGGRPTRLPLYPWRRSSHWLARTGSPAPRGARAESTAGDLYGIVWKRLGPTAGDGGAARRVARSLEGAIDAACVQHDYHRWLDELAGPLDEICVGYGAAALRSLGVRLTRGASLDRRELVRSLGIASGREPVLLRILEMLVEDGVLEAHDEGWRVVEELKGAPGARLAALRERFPAFRPELALLERCGDALASVLTGGVEAVELLFGDETVEEIYHDSPFARTINGVAARVVEGLLATEALRRREGPLRVLEVGAGTGGTTTRVLPVLPAGSEYVFTDVSALFGVKAKERFEDFPWLRFETLDIEREPQEQGFRLASFDLVIAANVLHATCELRRSVRHIHDLTAPGGFVLLVETVRGQRWLDLTFGLTDGWWRFQDGLREGSPLVASETWTALLEQSGFVDVSTVGSSSSRTGASVFLAQRPPQAIDGRSEEPGSWLLLGDPARVGPLSRSLRASGRRVVPADEGVDAAREDLSSLLEELASAPAPRRVVDLGAPTASGADALPDRVDRACRRALRIARGVVEAPGDPPPRLWLVTRGVEPVDGGPDETALAQAGLGAFGAVFGNELPERWGGVVDLDPIDPDVPERIRSAIESAHSEGRVALRSRERWVPRLAPIVPASDAWPAAGDGTYLITGGLGGIGRRLALWLVRRGAGSLVLVGRRGEDSPGAREVVAAVREAGAEVVVERVDVAERAQVAGLLERLDRRGGRLRGIFHAAGVYDDRTLARLDWPRFARVLAPKVAGAWTLHELTRDRPLDCFVLFSSATVELGLPGLANYAAANGFLSALAHHRRSRGLPALCVDWGGWSGTGMAEAVGEARVQQWADLGLHPMAPERGLRLLGALLGEQSTPQVVALRVDWSRFARWSASRSGAALFRDVVHPDGRFAGPSSVQQRLEKDGSELLLRLRGGRPSERVAVLSDHLSTWIARCLRLPPDHPVEPDRPFGEMGFDSLMSVELRNHLRTVLECDLPSSLVFDYPTVDELARHLAHRSVSELALDGEEAPTARPARPFEESSSLEEAVASLEALSEEEAQWLLDRAVPAAEAGSEQSPEDVDEP